jgi:two-component system response regulator ResD
MERREKRILVVDDDDAIRALLFTVLRRRGFRVDRVRDGRQAIDRCARCRYSVVFLDLMMPRMSGYEVLLEMEKWPAGERPFVIVLTAGNEPRNINAEIVGATIRKPFDIDVIIEMLSACLSTRELIEQMAECPTAESELPSPRSSPDKIN